MRISFASIALLVLCLVSPSTHLTAQSFLIPKISFTGTPAYSQAGLLTVSGLKPGGTYTQADIQAAAKRLSDTGLFTDIRFESNSGGLIFHLTSMPDTNLLPARFTNFIWWQPAELTTAIKSRVPLFVGSVPIDGNMQDQVTAALKAMLAERKITADVVTMPSVPAGGGTPTAISFAIGSPDVVVHSISLQQVSPSMQPKLAAAIKNLTSKPYDYDETPKSVTKQISEVYRNNGYLDIQLTSLTNATPEITSDAINVDLTATFNEGEPYRLSSLTWAGSDVLSVADFNKSVKLKPEDIASELALRQSLAPLANAYFVKGFQDAKVRAPATIDHATHHVSYTVEIVPGPQYRLQSLKVVGLSDQQRKDFDSAWGMKSGDLYDSTYLNTFLLKNTAIKSLLGYSATWRAVADPDTHLVDVTLTFTKGGSLVEVKN